MTELRVEPYVVPAALLGPENPLPFFRGAEDDLRPDLDGSIPAEDRAHMGWRRAHRVLPYRMQDAYTREKRTHAFRSVVLENEVLRAVFLPELGGHLMSLRHKPTQRELVERNPAFQPANLALRNAWFSGGVEWNVSHPGHHYLTCSPVFAARIEGGCGEPALRLYEWDRVKRFPFQIDLHLPPGSPFLFVHVRVVNPHDEELPMYWWTNIGVSERPGWRTLCPADTVICHDRKHRHSMFPMPESFGADITYPVNVPFSNSFFFRLRDDNRRWIAVLDEAGRGLVETSTRALMGRKMFCWGMGSGGRRWQEFLSGHGRAYIEIQAGLTRTQLGCIPMPARAQWHWTEALGFVEADPAAVHGADWPRAWHAAQAALERALPERRLDDLERQFTETADRPPTEALARGSGWGALERRRLRHRGEEDRIPAALGFGEETLGPDQAPWLALLEKGEFPAPDSPDDPGHWMVQPEWRALLEGALAAGRCDHWFAWLHLGVMRLEARDEAGARDAWERSLSRRRTGWALRNVAVLENRAGRREAARDLLLEAWEVGPRVPALAHEVVRQHFDMQEYAALRRFVAGLPPDARAHERIGILSARAALETGEFEEVEALFRRDLATIREGEVTLTDLWFALCERRLAAREGRPVDDALRERVRRDFPPPRRIDFRMAE